jgi:hypothetical protein
VVSVKLVLKGQNTDMESRSSKSMSAVDRQRLVGIVKDAQYDGAPHHQFPHVFNLERKRAPTKTQAITTVEIVIHHDRRHSQHPFVVNAAKVSTLSTAENPISLKSFAVKPQGLDRYTAKEKRGMGACQVQGSSESWQASTPR